MKKKFSERDISLSQLACLCSSRNCLSVSPEVFIQYTLFRETGALDIREKFVTSIKNYRISSSIGDPVVKLIGGLIIILCNDLRYVCNSIFFAGQGKA